MAVSREIDVVFLIADLSGYTALTEAHGGAHAADAVTRYVEIARSNLEPGCRIVERVGDEVLIVASDAAAGVKTALRLRDEIGREPLFPTVRAGIHGGRVVETSEGYFGAPLNLAARIAAHARGGQILCTQSIADTAAHMRGLELRLLGPVRFKNITEPVAVFTIETPRSKDEVSEVDPVCHMQVRAESAPARLPFEAKTYYFCSFSCARKFAASPDSYSE
jgi:adenylate cyclase